MSPPRTLALLCCLAGLLSCTSQETGDGGAPPGGTGALGIGGAVVPDSLIWPEDCAARWQYRCDSYDPLSGCTCDESIPEDIEECGGYGALYCDDFLPGPPPAWVSCSCRAGAPRGPDDCITGADYVCDHRQVSPPEQCRCDSERPDEPEDCEITERFQCQEYEPGFVECWCDESDDHPESACYGFYTCVSEEPRYGCRCDPPR